jgi:putative hydrolase of the HAD superfamily
VKQVFQELIPPDKFDSFFDHLYARFEHSDSWRLYDDVVSVLHTLKSDQMRLAVISNWDSRLPSLCDQLGLTPYFETLVVSSLVGYEKPHPAIFQIALDRTGLSPHEVIYVGDDPYLDYQGARKAGMKALHLDRNNRYPEHAERITTLNDILKLLNLNGR